MRKRSGMLVWLISVTLGGAVPAIANADEKAGQNAQEKAPERAQKEALSLADKGTANRGPESRDPESRDPESRDPESRDAEKEFRVVRFPIELPLPPGTMILPPDTPLQPGTKLGCHIGNRWVAVKVEQLLPTGPVTLTCEKATLEPQAAVLRSDLIIARNLLGQLKRNASAPAASPRHWIDSASRQEILASILDIDHQHITLRKPDGDTMKWPLESLHPDDLPAVRIHRSTFH